VDRWALFIFDILIATPDLLYHGAGLPSNSYPFV